ncbi:GNAT family N-acetyltransferase [Paenibacillus cremeus]|uniref:GNAT family N-acetyltransferase n=1 Tax=Paenibacillus cremeus TaxID=2163881 RepID=A0A559KFI8_9BACL|nr:GNAT family N-acetyltransferase [Paenibacillus cremeus]TVY10890.1 GNAT family N-acetyltransferase [Paenibacillus cremeus]
MSAISLGNVTAREMRPEELEQGLSIRNSIFSPITAEDWKIDGDVKTAAIAFDGEEVIGFIPLYFRNFQLVPGVHVTAAFENAVGTSEACRGRGVGSQMIEAACRFLPNQADALFLYRGDERSAGYRFYTNTGHSDLHYVRNYTRANDLHEAGGARLAMPPNVIISEDTDTILARQDELLPLFEDTYAAFGGFPQRRPGYWAHALRSTIYVAHPTEFHLVQLQEQGRLIGYAIVGRKQRDGEQGPLHVLEIAALGGSLDHASRVLQGVCAFSEQRGSVSTIMPIGYAHPFARLLPELGFQTQRRFHQVMAQLFDPRQLFERAWRDRLRLPGIRLNVWTPKRELTLLDGEGEAPQTVTLEMKEDTLTAWLLGRIDLLARIREGTITVLIQPPANPSGLDGIDRILSEIARAIPHADWVYHHLDYI